MACKYEPSVDDGDFDGILCDLDDQQTGEKPESEPDHITRGLVVKMTMWSILVTLMAAGGYGLATGDWNPLRSTWTVAAAPFGAIFARYVGSFDATTKLAG